MVGLLIKRKIVKRVALLTALCTLGQTAGIANLNQDILFLRYAEMPVYAANLSAEEEALRQAEQELIRAQYKVIEAQRALLEERERQLNNASGKKQPAPVSRTPEKRKEESRPARKQERIYAEPKPMQRQEQVRPEAKPAQQPERVIIEPEPSPRQEPVHTEPQPVRWPEQVYTEPQPVQQPKHPSMPQKPASAKDSKMDAESFAKTVWKENNGGVYVNKPVEPQTTTAQQQDTAAKTQAKDKQGSATAKKAETPAPVPAEIAALQKQNHGILAEEEKMIYTTDPSVLFTFTGMTRKKSVDSVLDALKEVNGRGTFFVTERELNRNADSVRAIASAGQEIGICIYPKPEEGFAEICADIMRVKQILKSRYGIDSVLVKQFSGAVSDVTREAVAATGCRLIGANMNAVQSRHKDYQSAEQILPEIMGPAVFSLGRGWIVNIRMDFYKKPELAAELLLYLKRKKIDNIAYNSFDDVSGINPENDSAYRLKSIGEVLADKGKLWTYPVPKENYVKGIERYPLLPPNATHEQLVDELSKRYFGEGTVNADDRSLGFTQKDFEKLDMKGTVNTDDNVIFLTFDDWGHDSAINPILYVLRKHGVPATFFVLTHNVIYSPNLLRAMAMEGHDIASHTNMHKAMAMEDEKGKTQATMGYEEYYNDVNTSYKRLESVVGDLQWSDGKPVLTKFLRPPTLAISEMGTRAILENGFEYIINGSTSTGDYGAPSLEAEIKVIRDGLYYRDKLRKGAIFVMHMTSAAQFTANALDVILTANEKKADSDPTKFKVGLLSDYLDYGYSQAKSPKQLAREKRRIKWW